MSNPESNSIKEIADIMLADEDFKNNILEALEKVTADGKIDQMDIPVVVGVVVENYNKFQDFKVSKDQIGDVLGYLCSELLQENKLIPEDQVDNIERLISNAIFLVLTNPIVEAIEDKCVSCFSGLFKKCGISGKKKNKKN
ncbi:hypothetical protein CPAV1605_986 [seawater metagenome]|uniref:Uncharacterized protein n=1 Tax=seawater metagenome TaxID=1561972 RepID=A0A5E8CJ39_9ZZZZ